MGTRCGVAIGVALLTASVAAQKAYTPPKTPWGEPDLRGTFTSDNSIGVPFERPPQYGDRPMLTDAEFDAREKANLEQIAKDNSERPETAFEQDEAANNAPRHWLERGTKLSHASSLVIDPPNGRLPRADARRPAAPGAEPRALLRARTRPPNSTATTTAASRAASSARFCRPSTATAPASSRAPAYVVIQNEMIHEARVIPIDSKAPRLGKNIHLYMGDPRGHWEGNTLVVDSTNFTDRIGVGGGTLAEHEPAPRREVHAHRARHHSLRVHGRRSRRRSPAKWTAALDLNAKPGYEIYEYACHEGNYGLRNMLSASRADDRGSSRQPRTK